MDVQMLDEQSCLNYYITILQCVLESRAYSWSWKKSIQPESYHEVKTTTKLDQQDQLLRINRLSTEVSWVKSMNTVKVVEVEKWWSVACIVLSSYSPVPAFSIVQMTVLSLWSAPHLHSLPSYKKITRLHSDLRTSWIYLMWTQLFSRNILPKSFLIRHGRNFGRCTQRRGSLTIQWYAMVSWLQLGFRYCIQQLTYYRLLETGDFSDFEIHCDEHVFKVHRAVIMQGCGYFKALIASSFKESIEQKVVLKDNKPAVVAR